MSGAARRRLPLVGEQRASMLDALRRHRDAQSEALAAEARRLGSPCFSGCHGCCYQLVLVELPDALVIARHLSATGRATPALRGALEEHASLADRLRSAAYLASVNGSVFLDRSSPEAACTIYEVRPSDCRTWFIHGVPDGSGCAPGALDRGAQHVKLPQVEEADLRFGTDWAARVFGPGARPVWVPLALGVLAALDYWDQGPQALGAWRARLDAATQGSFAFTAEG